MKCPNCEGDLPGSVFVCKSCGHRLTHGSLEKWRLERAQTEAQTSAVNESPLAAKMRARFTQKKPESNLLQFPVPANLPVVTPAKAEPDWRTQLKNRIQDHRARQGPETQPPLTDDELSSAPPATGKQAAADQLLLVESALKRINRKQSPPPATVGFRARQRPVNYPAAQSHALALMPEAERYAEEQRTAQEPKPPARRDAPIAESAPVSAPSRDAHTAAQLRAMRSRKLTGAHLPPLVDEEPSLELPELSLDTLPLAADTLSAEKAETAHDSLPVERLRAKASFFNEQPAEPEPEAETPWLTDEEAAVQSSKPHVWVGQPAPIWLRTLAGICDVEAAAILYLPFFSAYYAFEGGFDSEDYYLMAVMAIFVMFLYQLVTFTLNGRTIGMALFGLRNFDIEHAQLRITFARRLQQALGGTVGLLIPPFNFVVTRVTGFQRGFGDALAKTVTLRRTQE